MRHVKIAVAPLAIAAVLLTEATAAPAQACRGVPSQGGRFALQTGVGLTSGATSYGVDFTANLRGPWALSAGYALTDLQDAEPHGHTFTGRVAFEIPGAAVSVCPALEVGYSRVSGLSTNIYPGPYTTVTSVAPVVNVSAGSTLTLTPALFATPFAGLGMTLLHSVAQAKSGGFSSDKYKDDASAISAVLGLLVGSQTVHVGVRMSLTTLEDSDPLYTLGVGFVF
jgi:hypothetical protein